MIQDMLATDIVLAALDETFFDEDAAGALDPPHAMGAGSSDTGPA
jgi:hypothetical protein